MAEQYLINSCGMIVTVGYTYHPLTKYLMTEYSKANEPQQSRIYKAWDYVIRALVAANASTYFERFEVTDAGAGVAQTHYNFPELVDAIILDVTIEGQGVNESDPMTVNIDTETGDVDFGIGLTIGAQIKITCKKIQE